MRLPRPGVAELAGGRPLAAIVRQPHFLSAVLYGVVSYTVMNLVMTSAPLAMRMCGLTLAASNFAIQWHIVAMYAPSFCTGVLIARFGAQRIVAVGLASTLAAATVGLAGVTALHFSLALVLLGLGWNFGFVGASTLVLEAHRPEERTKVQAFNDFIVFGTMAAGSFVSGQVLILHGWAAVNWLVFPPVALLVLLSSGLLRARAVPAA